jgi:hypothetical protein
MKTHKNCKNCKEELPVQKYSKANFKFGLGISCGCYGTWLLNDPKGNEYLNKQSLKAKGSTAKKVRTDWTKEKTKRTIENLSADGYRSKYIQPLINLIARLIDNEQPCIATGNYGKMSGGHYHSVGSNRSLSLNLHNIHIQSYQSNSEKGGDLIKYRHGLINIYGEKYAEFVDMTLNQCPPLNLSKNDMVSLKPVLTTIIKGLKEFERPYTPKERIHLRSKLNKRIGVYKKEFALF